MDLSKLPQLAQDKANHHLYGEAAALAGALLIPPLALRFGHVISPRAGAAIAAGIAGAAKEAIDKVTGKGTPSFGDFIATCSGALPVIAGIQIGGRA